MVVLQFSSRRAARRIYICCVAAAAAGRNAYFIIAAWIVFDRSHSASEVAILLGLGSLAELLTSNVSGTLADRFDRRIICIISDLIRLLLMIGTGLVIFYDVPPFFLTLGWAAYAIVDRAYLAALQAIVPSISSRESLLQFNSLSYMSMQVGNLATALIAGLFLDLAPEVFSLVLPFVCFLTSLCAMSILPCCHSGPTISLENRFHASCLLPSKLPGKRWRDSTIIYALIYAMGMLVNVLGAAFVKLELQGSAAQFGYLETAWALGSIMGCGMLFAVSKTRTRFGLLTILAVSGFILIGFLPFQNLALAIVQMAALGIGYNIARVLIDVDVQRYEPDGHLGRVRGQIHTACVGGGLVIYSVIALLGTWIRPASAFGLFGLSMALIAIVMMRARANGQGPLSPRALRL